MQGEVVGRELRRGEKKLPRPLCVSRLPRVDAEVEQIAGIRIFRRGIFRLLRLWERGVGMRGNFFRAFAFAPLLRPCAAWLECDGRREQHGGGSSAGAGEKLAGAHERRERQQQYRKPERNLEALYGKLPHSRGKLLRGDFFEALVVDCVHAVRCERLVESAGCFGDFRKGFFVQPAADGVASLVFQEGRAAGFVADGYEFPRGAADSERVYDYPAFCRPFCGFQRGVFKFLAVAYEHYYLAVGRR